MEFFAIQSLFPNTFSIFHNDLTWFISCLLMLYLVFPLIHNFFHHKSKGMLFVYFLISSWLASSAGLFNFLTGGNTINAYYSPVFRLPEFISGYLLFTLINKSKRYLIPGLIFAAAILTLVLYLGIFSNLMTFFLPHNYIVFPLFLVITTYLYQEESHIPLRKWVNSLATIALMFYLMQGIIIKGYLQTESVLNLGIKNNFLLLIILLGLNFLLAYFAKIFFASVLSILKK